MNSWGKGGVDRSKLAKKTRAPYLWELGLGGHAQDAPVADRPGGQSRHAAVVHGHAAHCNVTDPQIGSHTQCVHPLVHRENSQDQDGKFKSPSIVKPAAPEVDVEDDNDSDFADDCRFLWCVPGGKKEEEAKQESADAETVSKKRRRRRLKLKASRRSVASAQP